MSAEASSSSAPRSARGLFLAYVCLLLVLTHWPRLTLPAGDIPRPDLIIHMAAFGLWTLLCVRAGWFGPPFSARNLLLAALTSVVYAGADEASQAIPALHRTCRADDFAANLLGVGAGLGVAAVLGAIDHERSHPDHGLG